MKEADATADALSRRFLKLVFLNTAPRVCSYSGVPEDNLGTVPLARNRPRGQITAVHAFLNHYQ